MTRFSRFPITLYRIQPSLPVALRSYADQMAKGRASFDLKLHDGLYKPIGPPKDKFHTPNGMSLRPAGANMLSILENFRGSPMIYAFVCGMEVPKDMALYHEHTDHYSLQTDVDIPLEEYNEKLTSLLQSLPAQTKEQFLEMLNDDNDQDN